MHSPYPMSCLPRPHGVQERKAEQDEQAARIRNARDFTAVKPEYYQFTVWDSLPAEIRHGERQ